MQDGADYGGVIVRNPFMLRVAEEATCIRAGPKSIVSRHRGRGRPAHTRSQSSIAGGLEEIKLRLPAGFSLPRPIA